MSAHQGQLDIAALLDADDFTTFAAVQVLVEGKTAEDYADRALAPRWARGSGKIAGLVAIVMIPAEARDAKTDSAHIVRAARTFTIRVEESVASNRPPGQALATGHTYDSAKAQIISRLHGRGIYGAHLSFERVVPFADNARGIVGVDLTFTGTGHYPTETRSAAPVVDITAGTATLTAPGTIRYTTDGSEPTGGTVYSAPFAIASGTVLRACATEVGKAVSTFQERVAP